ATGWRKRCLRRYVSGKLSEESVWFRVPPRHWDTPKVTALAARTAAVVRNKRHVMPAKHEVGVGLIVAEYDVVARPQALDQIVLEQQRFGFGTRYRDFQAHDSRHHMRNAGAAMGFLKIRVHPLLKIAGLAYIQ